MGKKKAAAKQPLPPPPRPPLTWSSPLCCPSPNDLCFGGCAHIPKNSWERPHSADDLATVASGRGGTWLWPPDAGLGVQPKWDGRTWAEGTRETQPGNTRRQVFWRA